jgi:predicted DNA-binding protein (MmcQ/YjbR family)
MDELRELALALPGTAEGVACAGTAMEAHTVTAGGKAFLFHRPEDLRLKLRDALPEATALAAAEPGRYRVGAHGWVTVLLADPPPVDLLARWVEESFRLVASKKLVAQLSTQD